MQKIFNFKEWLHEQDLIQLEMAWMRFGKKWNDRDVNEVPPGMWQWTLDKMKDSPNWTPRIEDDDGSFMTRDKVTQVAQDRVRNVQYQQDDAPATPQPQPTPQQGPKWILATAKTPLSSFLSSAQPGDHVVMTQQPNKNWSAMTRSGETVDIPSAALRDSVESVKGANGKPVMDVNPERLFAMVPEPFKPRDDSNKKSGEIPWEKMSEEQKKVDQRFAQIVKYEAGKQSHIVINADPGSGKTTMLNHLAWKYGKESGQKWLYLVFNSKNKVEAEQKFPGNVEVYTTNVFLGDKVLGAAANRGNIPQTDRIIQAMRSKKKDDDGPKEKLEKIKFIVDGKEFGQKLNEYGITPRRRFNIDDYEFAPLGKALKSLLSSILYNFKKGCTDLAGLAKAYAVDPRKPDAASKIKEVMKKHDTVDTELLDVKERISKYKPRFADDIAYELEDLLGYDFMSKDYKKEMTDACMWLLHQSLPFGTEQSHTHQGRDYNLGQLRDFSDDAWYAVTHAEELVWPKYDVVLADEIQDFNEARKVMLKKLHDAGARNIVAVGDTKQSLYRFIGADSAAIDSLGKMLGDVSHDKDVTHTLTLNFRSRPEVLDLVEKETGVKLNQGKHFEEGDGDGAGTKFDVKYDECFDILEREHQAGQLRETAFISRTNAPLTHAALSLLKGGVPFIVVGKDVGGDLMRHIYTTIKRQFRLGGGKVDLSRYSLDDLKDKLPAHLEQEQGMHAGKSTKGVYLKELAETTEALSAAIDNFREANMKDGEQPYDKWTGQGQKQNFTVADFFGWLKKQLGGFDIEKNEEDYKAYQAKVEEENPVILTTSHKSKGLEFERVYILRYDQFPHPKAKMEEDLVQEENNKFVALTRGQDEVHIVVLEGQPGYKEE